MGEPMALQLVKAGHKVSVYNRSAEKTKPLADAGAAVAARPADLGADNDIVFTMISNDAVLEEVTSGPDGVLQSMTKGAILVDMSTVTPAGSARVAEAAKARGVAYVRAPVSGSVVFAVAGTLTILASGPKDAFDACMPAFEVMGGKIYHVGEDEQARYLKLTLNMMVGITAGMAAEALTFSERGGVAWDVLLEVVANSAVASPLVGYKKAPLAARDWTPAFPADQMAKDFDMALDTARDLCAPLPITALVRQYWSTMMATGRGNNDFIACLELLEEQAGHKPS
jgi:3-hydroxyisobutyrate dehydrogenase-like beta-hydroxyacid dehydrogenase